MDKKFEHYHILKVLVQTFFYFGQQVLSIKYFHGDKTASFYVFYAGESLMLMYF